MAVTELHYATSTNRVRIPDDRTPRDQEVIDRAALAHLDFNPVHTNIEWNKRAQSSAPEDGGTHADHVHDGLADRPALAATPVPRSSGCSRSWSSRLRSAGWCAARDT